MHNRVRSLISFWSCLYGRWSLLLLLLLLRLDCCLLVCCWCFSVLLSVRSFFMSVLVFIFLGMSTAVCLAWVCTWGGSFLSEVYIATDGLGMGHPTSSVLSEVFMQSLRMYMYPTWEGTVRSNFLQTLRWRLFPHDWLRKWIKKSC